MSIKKIQRSPRLPLNYSFFHAVLDILYEIGEEYSWGSPFTEYKQLRRRTMQMADYKNWRLKRAMKYLESLGRVKINKSGDNLFIRLTKKGRLDALTVKLMKEFKKQNKWDGKWRLIIWDIPESSKRDRNQLRHFCKSLGFYLLQKSVFITPYPLPRSAVQYLKESGLDKFIRFLRVDQIDDDKFLLKYFDVKK